jgi:1,4-dihydroxy-2-naphthoate octaprenyltransferase
MFVVFLLYGPDSLDDLNMHMYTIASSSIYFAVGLVCLLAAYAYWIGRYRLALICNAMFVLLAVCR